MSSTPSAVVMLLMASYHGITNASVSHNSMLEPPDRSESHVHHLRRGQRPPTPMQPSPRPLSLIERKQSQSVLQGSVAPSKTGGPTLVRPNAGKEADKIYFALFAKNFYGDDLEDATFQIDVVMTLEWKDLRVVDLIPEGLENMTIASEDAASSMWMPDVVVTNRDIDSYEILSSSVTLSKSGEVHKTERVHVKICEKFALIDYPFDTEYLRVVIASSKYMMDDLILLPSKRPQNSGVGCPVGGYYVEGWTTSAFKEMDGNLKKSRGMLNIEVVRNLEKYRQDHLVPVSIVLCISCAVFYFPLVGNFVVPRLALSVLALLTFTNLMIKSADSLPGHAPYNWNDLLNQQVQGIMFVIIVTNIFSEICWHTLEVEWLARRLSCEAKIVFPVLAIVDLSFVMLVGYYELMTLRTATIAIQLLFAIIIGCNIMWIGIMLLAEKRKACGREQLDHRMTYTEITKSAGMH